MSVVDPVVLGEVKLTPSHFESTDVTLEVHVQGTMEDEHGEWTWITTGNPNGGPGIVTMPIKAWESYQAAALKVALYDQMFAAQQGAQA